MRCNLNKSNTVSFNLSAFLDYCRKDSRLNKNTDKIYEIVVCSFFETLLEYLNIQVNAKLDLEAKRLLKDFGLIQNFSLSLDHNTFQLAPIEYFHVSKTNRKNSAPRVMPSFETTLMIKYITLHEHSATANTPNLPNNKMIIVCKDAEKNIIRNFTIQLGIMERIIGIIPENILIKWYHKCINPKYIHSIGKVLMETLNKKFKKEFSLTLPSTVMTHL
jgi:hypothetical protein